MLLQDGDTASNTAHFTGSVGLTEVAEEEEEGDDADEDWLDQLSIFGVMGIAAGGTSSVFLAAFIVLALYYRKRSVSKAVTEMNLGCVQSESTEKPATVIVTEE